jgi:TIR domain
MESFVAPEEVYYMLALRLRFEDGQLLADGERVKHPGGAMFVTWYVTAPMEGHVAIAGGLVQVPDNPGLRRTEIRNASPTDLGNGYQWREPLADRGDTMIVMLLPPTKTLAESNLKPVEAKVFDGSIAVFWRLSAEGLISLTWSLEDWCGDLNVEVRRINQEGMSELVSAREESFDYDVALSFAGEDRAYVERVANSLKTEGVKVFYDQFEEVSLWGKNLYDHLSDVYSKRARYTVMFISQHYAGKLWTNHERVNAQARAFGENSEYILPVRFDDTPVEGLPNTVGYLSLHGKEPEDLSLLIVEKLKK